MQKIVPFLWFNDNAEEAIRHYISIFEGGRIVSESRYGQHGPGPAGSLMSATFELEGQTFMALNGGPMYTFTPAISLFVDCQTQEEVDRLWEKLLEGGGEPSRCGWLSDRFGVSWQIIPRKLGELLHGSDPAGSARAMQAMLGMSKLDIGALQRAYDGEAAE